MRRRDQEDGDEGERANDSSNSKKAAPTTAPSAVQGTRKRRRGADDEDAAGAAEPPLPRLNERQQRELNQLVEGLGAWDEETRPEEPLYLKHPDALEYVRDLQRCLRREDPEVRIITLQLGRWRFVSRHVLPLLIGASTSGDRDLAAAVVKLLVTLTMPLPRTAGQRVRYEHLSWLQEAKESFAHRHVIVAIMAVIAEPLLDRHEEHNQNLIELVITLFRNMLLIPDSEPSPTSSGTDNKAHLHDRLVILFHSENVFELFILVGQSVDGSSRNWNLLLLEIVYLLLRWETPQSIWDQFCRAQAAAQQRQQHQPDSATEDHDYERHSGSDDDDEDEVQNEEDRRLTFARRMSQLSTASRLQEQFRLEWQHKSLMQAASPTRHSRFGGTYGRVVKDGQQRALRNSVHEVNNTVLGRIIEKKKKGITRSYGIQSKKIKKPITRHASLEGLMALKDFATALLEKGCYNKLLEAVGEDIEEHDERLQSYDEVHFVWMVSFFTGFQRLSNNHKTVEHNIASSSSALEDVEATPDTEPALEPIQTQSTAGIDEYDISAVFDAPAETRMDVVGTDEAPTEATTKTEPGAAQNKIAERTKAQRLALIGPVAAGIEFEVFAFIARKLCDCVQDKQWEQAEVALRAVKEIVLWVNWMREEPLTVTAGNALLSNIIYHQEQFLSILIQLVRIYNPVKSPLSLLRDAVEALVVLLSMTEDYAKRYNGRVYVRAPSHRAGASTLAGGSDEEEDDNDRGGEQRESRADDTGADDVLNLARLISNLANNGIITNCCLLLKYHRLNPASVNKSIISIFRRLAIQNGDDYRALFYRLTVLKQFHDVLAEPEFLYGKTLGSRGGSVYAAGGLEGLEEIAQTVMSSIAKLGSTDPFVYIHLLFQKSRSDVTFQSLALAQTDTHANASDDRDEVADASGSKRAVKRRKTKKVVTKEKQWNKAEDEVLRELMDLFGDDPVDEKLFQFLTNGLPGVPEIDIGRRLVTLGLLSQEAFASQFPGCTVGSSKRSKSSSVRKDANTLADVFAASDEEDGADADDKDDAKSTRKEPKVRPKPVTRVAELSSDGNDESDKENNENDLNSRNVTTPPSVKTKKRSMASLCHTEDIEEEVLTMKLNHLAEDIEGVHALGWLIEQMKKCLRQRKKAEKNDDVVTGFVVKPNTRNEFMYLELRWLGRVMSEIGLRWKETEEGMSLWKIPSSIRARSLANRISILETALADMNQSRKKDTTPSRRQLLENLKRKRRSSLRDENDPLLVLDEELA